MFDSFFILCLNEANENKGEAAYRMLNSPHLNHIIQCTHNTHNIIFDIVNKKTHKERPHSNNGIGTVGTERKKYILQIIRMSYWTLGIVYDLQAIISAHVQQVQWVKYELLNHIGT